jgi:2-C-methyl-D-erythritol 4-phosphate cytidylyltransferase
VSGKEAVTEGSHGRVVAIVVAAGEPIVKNSFDRIFADLAGKPILAHSIAAFERCAAVNEIILVTNTATLSRAWNLVKEQGWRKVTKIVPGGARRQDSVAAGLLEVGQCDYVMIHDGSRPLVTDEQILDCLASARQFGAAILSVPTRDAVKMVNTEHMVRATPDRSAIWLTQTPQCFRKDLIEQGYRSAFGEVSDDSVLIERLNQPVKVCMGAYSNIKIATAEDLDFAQVVIRRRAGQPAESSKDTSGQR